MNGLEFLRLVGHALGISASSRLGKARFRLQDALADEAAEGRRWLLVVNQAHRGRTGVWDEVQAIANQLGRPRGFGALVIVGATELARSLGLAAQLASGLAASLCTAYSSQTDRSGRSARVARSRRMAIDEHVLEVLHRNSQGNPALRRSCAGVRQSIG